MAWRSSTWAISWVLVAIISVLVALAGKREGYGVRQEVMGPLVGKTGKSKSKGKGKKK